MWQHIFAPSSQIYIMYLDGLFLAISTANSSVQRHNVMLLWLKRNFESAFIYPIASLSLYILHIRNLEYWLGYSLIEFLNFELIFAKIWEMRWCEVIQNKMLNNVKLFSRVNSRLRQWHLSITFVNETQY